MALDRIRAFGLRVRGLLERKRLDRDLGDEIDHHLSMRQDRYRAEGLGEAEARAAASRRFGNATSFRERCRELWSFGPIETLWADLRFATRLLRKEPAFTAVAVLSLTLGIGANSAIFQMLDAVRFRPLPIRAPSELAEIRVRDMTYASGSFRGWSSTITNPVWERIRDDPRPFAGVFAWGAHDFRLSHGARPRVARGLFVSGNIFDVLGVSPAHGRLLHAADDRNGCGSSVAIVSDRFWRSELAADPAAVGSLRKFDDRSVEIIGVSPPGFFGLEVGRSFDIAMPLCAEPAFRGPDSALERSDVWWLNAIGRLENVSIRRADAEWNVRSAAIFAATIPPQYAPESVTHYLALKLEVVPAPAGISELRETYSTSLGYLLAIAALVLLIACVNLANLLLARMTRREREIAVRLAIGASRGRIVRQLLVESLLLGTIGAALGAVLAAGLSRAVIAFLSRRANPLTLDLHPDLRVLAFTAGLAIATSVLFGLAPAIRGTCTGPGAAMKGAGRSTTSERRALAFRRGLVVSQVALSLVLLVAAILFVRSLRRLVTADAGFHAEGMLVAKIDLGPLGLPPAGRAELRRSLLERIRALPAVAGAAEASIVPLSGAFANDKVWMEGSGSGAVAGPGSDRANSRESGFNFVGPGYFATLHTARIAGRDFDDTDRLGAPRVAIVTEAFSRTIVGAGNPLGRRFHVEPSAEDPDPLYEIVGVVRDSKFLDLHESFRPIAFLPAAQNRQPGQVDRIMIRSRGSLAVTLRDVEREVARATPADFSVEPLESAIGDTLVRDRLMASLSGFFGLLAVLLASVGLYGLVSYSVSSREAEIGVRMAVGAQPRQILWLVLRGALVLSACGVAAGLPLAFLLSRSVSGLLFAATPADPLVFGFGAVLMLAISLGASYLPSRRASALDPSGALRAE